MDFIQDRDVYAAVCFAIKMIREGLPVRLAIYRASTYYEVSSSEVAHFIGQRGGRSRR